MIQINNLTKQYKKFTLCNISFNLDAGEFLCLIGKNGAGKTTLIRILAGLLKFNSGKVLIDNVPVSKSGKINKLVGLVQQEKGLPENLTIYEYLVLQAKLKNADIKNIDKFIVLAELNQYKNTLIGKLSGGNKQKLHILSAILNMPKVVIMDEPTVGLDPIVRKSIWEYIKKLKEYNITIVISTHYLEEAEELGDKIAIIDNGKLFHFGTNAEIKKLFKVNEGFKLELVRDENEEVMNILKSLDFIKLIRKKDTSIRINIDEMKDSYLPSIVNILFNNGINLKMIRIFEYTLDDILCLLFKNSSQEISDQI